MPKRIMSGSEFAAKWSRNYLASKESMRRGVEGMTESPTEKAALQVDRYRSGCLDAADNGRFVNGCRAVGLEEWKSAYLEKGLKNMDNGVKRGETKAARFADEFLPYIQAEAERIQRMPKGGRANAMARIDANLDALEKFKKNRRR